jgi:hypothetical protein
MQEQYQVGFCPNAWHYWPGPMTFRPDRPMPRARRERAQVVVTVLVLSTVAHPPVALLR